VNPQYAVLSCGIQNDYGHPHQETMKKLQNRKIPVYRTDQQGTIALVSNGKDITFNVEPGNYLYGR
jgi:competence protein ComEC